MKKYIKLVIKETFWFLCHLFETILPANYYNNLYGV